MTYCVRLDYLTYCNQSESGLYLIFSCHFLKVLPQNANTKSVEAVKKKAVKAVSSSAVHASTGQPKGLVSQISSLKEKATRSLDVYPINLEGRRPSWMRGLGGRSPPVKTKSGLVFRLSKQRQVNTISFVSFSSAFIVWGLMLIYSNRLQFQY